LLCWLCVMLAACLTLNLKKSALLLARPVVVKSASLLMLSSSQPNQ
jgi:hypothetical protein